MKKPERTLNHFQNGFRRGIGIGTGLLVVLIIAAGGLLLAQNLTTFSSGQVVSAGAINSNFALLNQNVADLNARVAPIGGIIAWHKSLTGTPALPAGWVECNGQPITDAESPLLGQSAPNLNAAPNAWNAGGYYLRGSIASGPTQGDTFQGHRHWRNTATAAEHDMTLPAPGGSWSFTGTGFHPVTQVTTGESVTGLYGAPRPGNETRPVSFLVVWIMRIK